MFTVAREPLLGSGHQTISSRPQALARETENVETTFHLTQLLTGHGCFGVYLAKIRKLPSPMCPYCGDPDDTSLHTFFNCHIWNENRTPVTEALGQPLTPDMVQTILCGPPPNTSSSLRAPRSWHPFPTGKIP